MPVELKIPQVGESITEVVIGAWRKSVGDPVERDEEVVELETDKATFELPAPGAGVITRILKESGQTAAVGEVIGYVGDAAESESAPEQKSQPAAPAPRAAAQAPPAAEAQKAPSGAQAAGKPQP